MSSDLVSISPSEKRRISIRDKIATLKQRAALSAGEPTDPAFEDSFGNQLSDLDGRRRWVLVGFALQKWHQDLRDRVGEVLREYVGEIYKGRSIRGTATLHHCWMLGYDRTCAHPTVVISCNHSTILKRTMRVISQHGVLKAAKFALKGVPFCDLKLRTEPGGDALDEKSFVSGELGETSNMSRADTEQGSVPSLTDSQLDRILTSPTQSTEPGSEFHKDQRKTDTPVQLQEGGGLARQKHDTHVPPQAASPSLQSEGQHLLEEQQTIQQQEQTESSPRTYARMPPKQEAEKKPRKKTEEPENADREAEVYRRPYGAAKKEREEQKEGPRVQFNEMLLSEETKLVEHDLDTSDDDELPLRFGAEEITVPHSRRPTTLGGFLMVDDVCFGLTAAHAFIEESRDFEQQALAETEMELQLYDSDWANEDSDDDENESVLGFDSPHKAPQERQLHKIGKRRVAKDQTYESSNGEVLRITAKSRLISVDGLDWALCELGDWGKFAINGVYLSPELRGADALEYLLFGQIKSTPPLGKVLVATRRGAVPGLGTGSDCSIKLGRDDRYRRVWSIQLEESLSSGDSGSWVVDASTGDVYGIVVAGSTGLREEYIMPAFEIGQDICRVLRADTVRLPTIQDVMAARAEQPFSKQSARSPKADALDWETDDSVEGPDEMPLDEEEKRFLLAEVLKYSSIDTKTLARAIKDAEIRPKWTNIALPKGRSLKTAQRAVDCLLANRRPRESYGDDEWAYTRPKQKGGGEKSYIREASASTHRTTEGQSERGKSDDDNDTAVFEEASELLDSNPSFRAEMSRRAWRAKRRADQGPKPHHRKHRPRKRSGEVPHADPILQAPGSSEPLSKRDQSKLERNLADEQGRDDPDVIILRHKGSTYILKFPPFSLAEGSCLIGDLRQQAAAEFGVQDTSRVTLIYKGKSLKFDTQTCHEEGLRMRSEVLCVVKRTSSEELGFLANKFRTELVPQGIEFISNTPDETKRRDFEYNKISETILTQILMKSDAVDTEGDENARMMRRKLVEEAQSFLNDLDLAARKDSPAAWHADFISQKQETGSPPARPSFSGGNVRPFGSNIRRSSTRDSENPGSKADEG